MLDWQPPAILFEASFCHANEAGRGLEADGGFYCLRRRLIGLKRGYGIFIECQEICPDLTPHPASGDRRPMKGSP